MNTKVALISFDTKTYFDYTGNYEIINYLFRNCTDWEEVTPEECNMLQNWCFRHSNDETVYVLIRREECVKETIQDCIKYAKLEEKKKAEKKKAAQEKKLAKKKEKEAKGIEKLEVSTELKRKWYEELKKEFENG